jgi:hypothetical protein
MYRLVASNLELAELARKAESFQVERDRRWARLGAATLFPLLFLSLLGVNTFPITVAGQPMQALTPFIASTIVAAVLSVLGYAWAASSRGDKKSEG